MMDDRDVSVLKTINMTISKEPSSCKMNLSWKMWRVCVDRI